MVRRVFLRLWTSSVGWSLAVTALRAGGFLLVLPLALRHLTPEEMGLWYLFVSIGELCAFAELGLGPVLGRTASFFVGGMTAVPRAGLPTDLPSAAGSSPNLAGLAGLLQLGRSIYLRIALGVAAFMATIGAWMVWAKAGALPGSAVPYWVAYGVFTGATAVSMLGLYWPHFLSGLGHVRQGQRALLAGLLANYALSALGLLAGCGPLSLALGQLALAATTFGLARATTLAKLPALRTTPPQPVALTELWPATWRSLLVSAAGYLTNYGTVLVCGLVTTLATTASFGVSFRLAAVIHGVSAIWLNVRLPGIATARAAGDRSGAQSLVRSALPRCLGTYALGALTLWVLGPLLLQWVGSRTPPLPGPEFALLLLLLAVDLVTGFHSAVILTANRFPHLPVYLGGGLAATALALALGWHWGVPGLLAGPLAVQVLLLSWWISARCWRELRS